MLIFGLIVHSTTVNYPHKGNFERTGHEFTTRRNTPIYFEVSTHIRIFARRKNIEKEYGKANLHLIYYYNGNLGMYGPDGRTR